jgi:hypothetical protein
MAGHVELFVQDKRKRHRQKRQPPETRNPPRPLLEVTGRSCTIFEDEALAAYVDSTDSLVPWIGDSELQIDRHDARHLLSDLSSIRKGRADGGGVRDIEEEELNKERYFDLENEPGAAEYLEELEGKFRLQVLCAYWLLCWFLSG